MSKNLVIVESPAKAKTIEKFLGKDFKVKASYGHVRDLPRGDLGVDVENNYEPRYVIPTKARKKVNELKKDIAEAKDYYLASDPDREGEAIAWHISKIVDDGKEPKRVVFTEITEEAVKKAFANPRSLDRDLVDAQQGRRILDRLVGYNLSPLLWKKVRRGLSAGRVQSVAVKLIVDRERERNKFKEDEYWQIEAILSKKEDSNNFKAILTHQDKEKLDKLAIKNEQEANAIANELESSNYLITKIDKKERKRYPKPPFITSTLQQAAANRLGFTAKKTMMVAQQLYEGIKLGSEGSVGLITYMRTDSLNLSNLFIQQAQEYINKNYGKEYGFSGGRRYKSKSKGAQEAHEAIRPTYADKSPDLIKEFLAGDQLKLYKLIYDRALASQMAEAKVENTAVDIQAGRFNLRTTGSVIIFDGFMKIMYQAQTQEDQLLPELSEGEQLDKKEIIKTQSFTQPPARYTEASLVKALEENGIGRPSTYAPTISTIVTRGYVQKEQGSFVPQEIGFIVNDLLVNHFPDIVNIEFTAHIEEDLDKIAEGKMEWRKVIGEFYEPFAKDLEKKHETIEKHHFPEVVTDIKCEKCGKNMVEKIGRFGKFLACSGFPECKTTKAIKSEIGVKCPKCDGEVVEKKTRRGKVFYGCSSYPKCEFASWYKPTGEKCPKCNNLLVQKGKKISCLECDFTKDE